jgi:hypothetical protein
VAAGDELDHANRTLHTLQLCALHRRTIELTCPPCHRVRRLDAVAIWWHFARKRLDDRLPRALRRAYCVSCRYEHGRIVRPKWRITRDASEPSSLPYPDQRTWRQLVSRYRS